jgi:predicted TIM-barrel fold metal-dependent hydrolase
MTDRVVDCHAHVFTSTARSVRGARYRPAYAASLASWQGHWRRSGATHGVLVQPSFFGTDNSEMLAAIAQDRARLRGVAVLDPEVTDAELERLDAAGVTAIRFNLRGGGEDRISLPPWMQLVRRIADRGWHLEVFTDAGRVPAVAAALVTTPVRVVFDHFGHPDPAAMKETFAALRILARSREVWAKLSAPYRLEGLDPAMLAKRWIDLVGPSRLVWGSDWPWTGHEQGRDYRGSLQQLRDWLGNETARAVLWDNPARLYRFA